MQRIYTANLEKISGTELESLRRQYMEEPMSLLDVDASDAKHLDERLHGFLRDYKEKNNVKGYFIALSGGLDSSLCAYLASEAIGADNCYGARLPSGRMSSQHSLDDAKEVADKLGIRLNDYRKVEKNLDAIVDLVISASEMDEEDVETENNYAKARRVGSQGNLNNAKEVDDSSRIKVNDHNNLERIKVNDHNNLERIKVKKVGREEVMIGNDYARARMMISRRMAHSLGYLVVGTTNATEAWLAYFTTAGDGRGGIDIEPIMGIPKTSERIYAKHKGLPGNIIGKAPSAELWQGQTDEDELSKWVGHPVTYESIDRIMVGIKLGLSADDIVKANSHPLVNSEVIQRLAEISGKRAYKNNPEPSPDLSR